MSVAVRIAAVLVLAALAGGAAWSLKDAPNLEERPAGDRLGAALDDLTERPVHIAPELQGWLSDEQVEQISTLIETGDLPVRVLVWEDTSQGGYRTGREAVSRLGGGLREPAVYLTAGPGALEVEEYDLRTTGMARLDESRSYDDAVLEPAETTERIVAFLQDLDAGSFEERDPRENSYWGGTGGMIAAIVLLTVLIGGALAGVGAVVWFMLRAKRSQG